MGEWSMDMLPPENLRQAMHTLFGASFERCESFSGHSSPEASATPEKRTNFQAPTETASIGGTVRPFSARL